MITINSDGNTISQAFINAISDTTKPYIVQLVNNGEALDCAIERLDVTKGSTGAVDAFNLGAVVASSMVATVKGLSETIKGEVVEAQVGLCVDEANQTYEYVTLGHFFVSKAKATTYTTTIEGYGATVSRTTGAFTSPQDMTPPKALTIANIADEVETEMGVSLTLDSSIDTTAELTLPMSGITTYQALQILASVVGGYAVDTYDGNVEIKLYDDTVTHSVNTGMMVRLPEAEEEDYEVTGVLVNTAAGAIGSQTAIDLVTDANWLTIDMFSDYEANIVGYTYRPASFALVVGDPRIDGTDVLGVTDVSGDTYSVPCHLLMHSFSGGLTTTVQSANATQISNDIATPAPITSQLGEIRSIANEAEQEARNVNQYFWHTTTDTGAGAGAHITQIPQVDFIANPSGGNALLDSDSIDFRKGLNTLATFGTDGMTIFGDATGSTEIANLGYGSGTSSSGGTADAPYYTLGNRNVSNGIGNWSIAEGETTTASGYCSHAEGYVSSAESHSDHAEGNHCIASGGASHAEGSSSMALKDGAHAEGMSTSDGYYAHTEGTDTYANGDASHAEGYFTEALADYAHSQNCGTEAQSEAQTALGKWNVADANDTYAVIIGNGTDDSSRSNALTVAWDGSVDIKSGAVYRINGSALSASDVGAVPTTRKVNGHALSSDVTVTASDVGAVPTSDVTDSGAVSKIPKIKADGVLEVSQYIDLHDTTSSFDHDVRFAVTKGTSNANGTLNVVCGTFKINSSELSDFVIDKGTTSSWYWRKWKSGKIEAWRTANLGSQTPAQWVTGWYYKDYDLALPSGLFSSTPANVVATNKGTDYQYMVFCAVPTSATNIRVRLIKPNSGAATPNLSVYVSNMT